MGHGAKPQNLLSSPNSFDKMASKTFARTLRTASKQKITAPSVPKRSFVSAVATRPVVAAHQRASFAGPAQQQIRGVKTIDFAGTKEDVYERADWPREKLLDYFKNDTLALIGYGSQGHGQGLNLRDNGLNVIIGVRKNGASWKEAEQDGWIPGKNLFEVDDAISRGTIIMNLLSDAAQSETWPAIKPQLTKGKTLYFSHGFSPVFKDPSRLTSPRTLMSSLSPPRVLAEPSDLFSVKVVASTHPLPSSRTLPAKLKRRLSL